jgi:hypothetical protein
MDTQLDVIGDLHGYADVLDALLGKLGYCEKTNHAR